MNFLLQLDNHIVTDNAVVLFGTMFQTSTEDRYGIDNHCSYTNDEKREETAFTQ